MASYTQSNRILAFTSPLGANTLLAMRFSGVEEISELFRYTIDVLADSSASIDPVALVGKRCTLDMQVTDDGTKRHFNGIVSSFASTGGDTFFHSYQVTLAPSLWLLSLNTQTRVFQNKSVLAIADEVLAPYSISPSLHTQGTYLPLEYCTQYRETDLAFLLRLFQQHGIFFFFTHTASDHILNLADSGQLLSECPTVSSFRYSFVTEEHLSFYEPRVTDFAVASSLVPGEHTSWDFRFKPYQVSHASPETARSKVTMGDNSHERYDFSDSATAAFKTPGGNDQIPKLQTQLQNAARDASDAQATRCLGNSNALTMQAGSTFTLTHFPQTDLNAKYLLTRVQHDVEQRPGYRAEYESGRPSPYLNSFEARPFAQPFHKEQTLPKPRVTGVVTGKVVTPAGEDSFLDRYGRVCVQFWWDRQRPPNTPDNTLLRVAQSWAGKGWGTYFWPRVGDEVLIDFIEGDPDAPIVVGSVYNGVNMPKYDPRSKYTRSGILTRSSKGGGPKNANELRFEDKMGAEQIFLNAERDMDHRTEHDHRRWVGNRDSLFVSADQLEEIQGSRETSILSDRRERVAGTIQIQAGTNIVVEATSSISLRVEESFITIDPSGVTLSGPLVRINSGGSPTPSSSSPRSPDLADDGTKGTKL